MRQNLLRRFLSFQSDNRKSKSGPADQNLKWAGFLAVFVVGCGAVAHAQQQAKIPWIGYLCSGGSGPSPVFILGLRDLGYVEGKNIGLVFRTVVWPS